MFSTARPRSSRGLRAAALVVAASTALVLSACSTGGDGSAAESTTLTIAVDSPPASLDPTTSGTGNPLAWYTALAYEPLIQRDPDSETAPGLATEWGYAEDRLSFTMTIREDAKFSDGDEVTPEAVVEYLEHYKAEGAYAGFYFANVTDFEVTGENEVTLTLSAPDPMLPYHLGQGGLPGAVVSPTGLANSETLVSETHGAGPYVLDTDETIANATYVYVKNPNYYAPENQHYEKIVLQVITDPNAVLSALRSGQVQAALGSASTAGAAADAGFDVYSGPAAMLGVYFADRDGTVVPALADERVRQALNYALDREAIVASIYGEYGTPTSLYVPEGMEGYQAELEQTYPYDPEKAKELLAEAGYPDGFGFTLLAQPGVDEGDLLAAAIADQWAAIGVVVDIKSMSNPADYNTEFYGNTYGATTLTFDYAAQNIATNALASSAGGYNTFKVLDADADALLAEERKYDTKSPEGVEAAEAAEAHLVTTAIGAPVVSSDTVIFAAKSVTGVDFSIFLPQPQYWKPAG